MKKIAILMVLGLLILTACTNNEVLRSDPNDGAVVPYLDDGWVSVWNDEFDGDHLNLNNWNFENGGHGWGNNELQYYTPYNTTVKDGILSIEVKKEDVLGKRYSSSRITTKYKGDFKYGRIQVRAKLPKGRGTWPAIWMMPTDSKYGVWPNSGEIDIMEHVGYDHGMIHSTVHSNKFNHKNNTQVGFSKKIQNVDTEFHLYELIWEPGQMTFMVNGESLTFAPLQYLAHNNQDVEYHKAWPFDQNFFLILNVAVGGDWGGVQGVDDSIFPQKMEVDYVRVYQRDYLFVDKSAPEQVKNINKATNLANSIWWLPTFDDYGVNYYEIFVDGELLKTSNMNQVMLNELSSGSYNIKIRAVDFLEQRGEFSDPFTFIKQ